MRSVHLSAITLLALGALAPSAFAAQTFSFANPFAAGGSSYANSMFESTGIQPANAGTPISTLESFYAGTVNLVVTGGSTAGSYLATYTLLDAGGSPVLNGAQNPSGTYTITEGGTLVFNSSTLGELLRYTFLPGGLQSTGGFGVSPARGGSVAVTGQLVDLSGGPIDQTKSKFSFSFPGSFAGPASTLHYTSDFNSSVEAVPEPASMGVLAVGAVAMLRRRRRA